MNRLEDNIAGMTKGCFSQSKLFGSRVFSREKIRQRLPKKEADNWLHAMDGKERVKKEYLNLFAETLKKWALEFGASHYTHWFHPMNGAIAEKHDSFLRWGNVDHGVMESFSGKDLLQTEPDASSFPSGGLRSIFEARGYTVWDPSTPAFLWMDEDGATLCIPALFFSWKAEALDYRVPLLRSNQRLEDSVARLLKLARVEAASVFSTVGCEQEYFLLDQTLFSKRPDLVMSGRTVYGSFPAKGQEMQEHYFSSLHPRVLAFMRDFEKEALCLGIPIKTRHHEVAPCQHEVAPLFEKASLAADHNLLLMELMRKSALRHQLACIFHEKPFASMNGSGKHCNWSLATDKGLNLLDPEGDSFVFLTLIAAVLRAVHQNRVLLRCAVATASNDLRLASCEAPSLSVFVYLGQALEEMIEKITLEKKISQEIRKEIDLGLSHILPHEPDFSDRNRSAFFAFCGDKFEFRAVGASQHIAWPLCIFQTVVADSLDLMMDEIEDAIADHKKEDLLLPALCVLKKHFLQSQSVVFSSDHSTKDVGSLTDKKDGVCIKKSPHAYASLRELKTERIFRGILSKNELESRIQIFTQKYVQELQIEANLMVDLFYTEILPGAIFSQSELASSLERLDRLGLSSRVQRKHLELLSQTISEAMEAMEAMEEMLKETKDLGWEAASISCGDLLLPKMELARSIVDRIEKKIDSKLLRLPKYSELLFFL